jgi:hydroxymethylglutaryl-CoA reductase
MDIPFEGYVKCDIDFETQDAMGANFINSCLEAIAKISTDWINANYPDANCEVIMAILSNHYPDCTVTASVSAPLEKMEWQGHDGKTMSERFVNAVLIANHEIQRAVTHNKGIMNGVDSVVLATGNDFRAVEAACHAFASTSGQYRSLSNAWINDNTFTFSITLPLALGTIGGLTKLHPLAQTSLELLGNPSAKELMMIVASIGLMSNFAAVRALTSTGIQKGHMKLHLSNLLLSNNASKEEIQKATNWFKDKEISSLSVKVFLENLRNPNQTI